MMRCVVLVVGLCAACSPGDPVTHAGIVGGGQEIPRGELIRPTAPQRYVDREAPLVRALLRADLDSVRALVTAEAALRDAPLASVKWRGRQAEGRPLHFAAERDLCELAALLLELGADPRLTDGRGATPLHRARSARMVELLVAAGADPRARTKASDDEPSATTLTTVRGFSRTFASETARALVAAGARLQLADAVRLGWEREVDELLSAAPGRAIHPDLLYDAARNGDDGIVALLIRGGVDVNGVCTPSRLINYIDPGSALEVAVQAGAHVVATRLLKAGATGGGRDQLVRIDGWEFVRFRQLVQGMDGDLLDRALHDGAHALASALLKMGFDPDEAERPSERGEGRLHRVAWRGDSELVALLLDAGAEVDATVRGARALLAAAAGGHDTTYELLLARGATPSLHAAAALGRHAEVEQLARDRAHSIDERDARCGRTPLAWAVHSGSVETVEALLALGADPEVEVATCGPLTRPDVFLDTNVLPDADYVAQRQSVLALAVERGRVDLVQRLSERLAALDRERASDDSAQPVPPDRSAFQMPADRSALAFGNTVPGTVLPKLARRAEVLALLQRTGGEDPVELRRLIDRVTWTGDLELLRVLVERGDLTWDHVTQDGDTLLHRGAESAELVHFLLARGMAPDVRGSSDETPLHEASKACALDAMRVLLAAGAAVDARNDRGDTPLLSLLGGPGYRTNLVNAAELLLEAGADPLAIGYSGPRAIEEASWSVEVPAARAALRVLFARHVPREAPRGLVDELFPE